MSRTTRIARRIAAAAGAAALVATAAVTAAQPATAAGTGDTCPANRLCLYFNSGLGGARADLARTDGALNNELFSDGPPGRNGWNVVVGNNAASVWNRAAEDVILFDRAHCESIGGTGGRLTLYRGQKANLASAGLQNKVSSVWIPGSGNTGCVNIDQTPA